MEHINAQEGVTLDGLGLFHTYAPWLAPFRREALAERTKAALATVKASRARRVSKAAPDASAPAAKKAKAEADDVLSLFG